MKPSEALLLFRLFEENEGKVPHGTKEYVVDAQTSVHIARRLRAIWVAGDVFAALEGFPVRAAFGVVKWVEKEAPGDPEEQLEMLRRWSSKHESKRRTKAAS